MHMLQQGTGTCINNGTGTGIGIVTSSGIGIGPGAHDVDYCLTTDGLVRFRDMIHVPDNSEVKKVILREFHVKPYSHHPGYQKTLTTVKRIHHQPNLKRDVAKFVARCFDYQCVKAECKHPGGIVQLIVIP